MPQVGIPKNQIFGEHYEKNITDNNSNRYSSKTDALASWYTCVG